MTCLFTGDVLSERTRQEHTIQRGLGGRIVSRSVSSDRFNGRCGGLIDPFVIDLYADVMSALGPVLPAALRGGDRAVEIPGHPGRYVIDERGQLTMRGAAVVGRDPITNRPTAVLGADEAAMRRIIDQNIQPGATERRREEAPPGADVRFPPRATLCAEIELAVMKAGLLTFDHLLQQDPHRFTRSEALADAREALRLMVMDGDAIDADEMIRMALGLQYDDDYLRLYGQIRAAAPFAESPFEHVLIASGNPATRSLDMVFWAYRHDPHAFRLGDRWQGEAFTYVVVNGVLCDTGFSEALFLPQSQILGRPTQRRSHLRLTRHLTPDERDAIHQEMFERRTSLYRNAVDYVERHCDEILVENLERAARLNPDADRRAKTAVRRRLELLFGRRIENPGRRAAFEAAVEPIIAESPDDEAPLAGPPHGLDWAAWLAIYWRCLDALAADLGRPGEIFLVDRVEAAAQDGARVLGRWPDQAAQ